MVGQRRLTGEMGWCSTRHPVRADRERRDNHRHHMGEALKELSTTMVAEDFQIMSGHCCIYVEWRNI
jgi:hypothetical protein